MKGNEVERPVYNRLDDWKEINKNNLIVVSLLLFCGAGQLAGNKVALEHAETAGAA